ncbi:hypothetical protein QKU48_gp1140 [Fadolivirus algeromassiliense]|jgi:hypothetical protein|uniref:Uncharacterized protein n=1 Tax=Fadolivirus FV1/VV64 TaxID=3070911 RepID=A0A7D3R2L9_9VIRU|nr:hypothetical protein QKU48_gp1140 [Fadolivirus algeromassiliense]QKF94598.1 hypothetical protein Fadolivirus_1_1140 [Fadolivirus FV1/VV64]
MNNKKHTIRNNKFDKEYINQIPIFIDENDVKHSINKNKNWELLDDPNIKQIKYHRGVTGDLENTALTHHSNPLGYGGGSYGTIKKGKDYVIVNGQRQNDTFNMNEQTNCIVLPFQKDEFPINREPHTLHTSPCKCCFINDGRIWQLKGLGEKSLNKNKGMQRERQRDMKYYHDY